jgi:hypothetical protein
MQIQGLDLQIVDGATLDDALLDRCFRLRKRFMALKPAVHPDDDRAAFFAWMRRPGCLLAVGRDAHGEVQLFIEMNADRITHQGTAHLVLYGNFVFVAEAYRGHPGHVLGTVRMALAQIHRRGLHRPIHWLIGVYPTGFQIAARAFGRLWIAGEPEMPGSLAGLVDHMAHRLYGKAWDPERRLVNVRTLPQDYQPRGPAAEALYARYVARNPDWRAGYNVLALVPMDLPGLTGLARFAARRVLRG